MIVDFPCRSNSSSLASSPGVHGFEISGRVLGRSLDMRIAPDIGAAFDFLAAFAADERLSLV
jgi:hypothetical protein